MIHQLDVTLKSGATIRIEADEWEFKTTGSVLQAYKYTINKVRSKTKRLIYLNLDEVAAIVEVKR